MAQVKAMRAMNLNTQIFIVHFSLSSIALNAAGYVEVGRVFFCPPKELAVRNMRHNYLERYGDIRVKIVQKGNHKAIQA